MPGENPLFRPDDSRDAFVPDTPEDDNSVFVIEAARPEARSLRQVKAIARDAGKAGSVGKTRSDPIDLTRYSYSFSGADADVMVWFPQFQQEVVRLPSVHTLAVSVHEAKGQARALGHRGIRGVSRGVRTIAGSLILTVTNDHPLADLMHLYGQIRHADLAGWSVDREHVGVGTFLDQYTLANVLPTLLPPFDLAVHYVSEMAHSRRNQKWQDIPPLDADAVGQERRDQQRARRQARRAPPTTTFNPDGAGLLIRGIEFLDDGLVTSVNDIVSEMTFSFIAYDYKPLARFDVESMTNEYNAVDDAQRLHTDIMNRCWS